MPKVSALNLFSRGLSTNILVLLLSVTALWLTGCKTSQPATLAHPAVKPKPHAQAKPQPVNIHPEASLEVQKSLVTCAQQWLGTPYKWGGQSTDGADCSGFVMSVFSEATGIAIPRNSRAQQKYCIPIASDEMAVGDLLFFSSPKSGGEVSHVGMYIGNGTMIHSSSTKGVIESPLSMNYYQTYFHSAGRVPQIAQALPVKNATPVPNPTAPPAPHPVAVVAPKPTEPDKAPKPQPETASVKPENVTLSPPTEPSPTPETIVANAFAGRKN